MLSRYVPGLYSSSFAGEEKVYIPVSKDQVIYSHMEHVEGYASDETSTVPIDKLLLLNNLLDSLVSIGKNREMLMQAMENDDIDKKIEKLHTEFQLSMKKEIANPYFLPVIPEAGSEFSLYL
ncbi:MAG: hypothetical protein IIW10_02800 [Spirochaetaceae bacterium]|nr:hypothetical protein [Spirochaetaceae bacterium]